MSGLSGHNFVAGEAAPGVGEPFAAIDPVTGDSLEPTYREAGDELVERACRAAGEAAVEFASVEPQRRAALLRAIADGLAALGDELVQRVHRETALPEARVEGERARTVLQLQQFAALIEDGAWVDARIDHADPDRRPQPKPDLRRMAVPLGPSSCSAPATSRSPTRSPAAIPRRRSPLAVR